MKFKHFFLIATILLLSYSAALVTSCSFRLTPVSDGAATEKVTKAFAANLALYDKAIASPDKKFSTYAGDYDLIETKIHEIIVIDEARKNSKIIVGMANDILEKFVKYKNEHRDAGSLNNSQLLSYKDGMIASWKPLEKAELGFK